MKKLLAVMMACLIIFIVTGCSGNSEKVNDNKNTENSDMDYSQNNDEDFGDHKELDEDENLNGGDKDSGEDESINGEKNESYYETDTQPSEDLEMINKNLLIREWEAEVPWEGYTFYFRLSFISETEVEYIAGYALSEIIYSAKGTYELSGDMLTLTLKDEDGTKSSVYRIEADENFMTMYYVSGEPINVVQGDNTSLTYHTRIYY